MKRESQREYKNRKQKHEKGDVIGNWILEELLGSGGNGVVWRCKNIKTNEDTFAIKILKWNDNNCTYKRFVDEIAIMEKHQDIAGVLPIVDKNLSSPDSKRNHHLQLSYYVMPLAEPAEKKILGIPLHEKIEVIKQLLRMLSSLHQNKIAHRDIKLANILFYEGKYVLSDFGLVKYEGKDENTKTGMSMGPKWTMSPQMRRDAASADGYKADVYSMAKTIWVILSGEVKAFDGQYVSNSSISISKYVNAYENNLAPLDDLLQQCTDNSERIIPSAEQLESRFNEWAEMLHNYGIRNVLQWIEIQNKSFPYVKPVHAEWTSLRSIVQILTLLSEGEKLNHMAFPNGTTVNIGEVSFSRKGKYLKMREGRTTYEIMPQKISYEYVSRDYLWNYFVIEAHQIEPITEDFDSYSEELYRLSSGDVVSIKEAMKMSEEQIKKHKPRYIVRCLMGPFIVFPDNSIYKLLFRQNMMKSNITSPSVLKQKAIRLSKKFKGFNAYDVDIGTLRTAIEDIEGCTFS